MTLQRRYSLEAQKLHPKKDDALSVEELDAVFKSVLEDLSSLIIQSASSAVNNIMSISSNFMDGKAQSALNDFRDLYFLNKDIGEESKAINKDVDDIFDNLQAKMDAGLEVDYDDNESKTSSTKKNRMALSGLQKELEMIITMDKQLKEKLLPVLSTMQFENTIKQRVDNLSNGWLKIIDNQDQDSESFRRVLEEIAKTLTYSHEREFFYPKVLETEAPADLVDEQSLTEIFS